MVEHAAVNRGVVGSSPTRGVIEAAAEAAASMPGKGMRNAAPWSSG